MAGTWSTRGLGEGAGLKQRVLVVEWCFEESTLQRRYPSNLVGCLTGRLQRERERETGRGMKDGR